MNIIENYKYITGIVREAELRSGRHPGSVRILTVSKNFPASSVQEAINIGVSLFGENRVQEARSKIPELTGQASFHLIGHLQSNKAKDAVSLFDVIHSIDKFSTAERVSREAVAQNKTQEVYIQINGSEEATKNGISPSEAVELAGRLSSLEGIKLSGVMTMAEFSDNEKVVRKAFSIARKTRERINSELGLSLTELSMGMSSDFETAIEEGATIVRIGSAIFGERYRGRR